MATYNTLRSGSKGEDVKKLQTALNNAGYSVGSVDGIYGNKTAAAVKAYQKANGLSVDGIAGNQTLGSLYTTKATNTTTNKNTTGETTYKLNGVDQSLTDKMQSSYKASDEETSLYNKSQSALGAFENLANQENIIDQSFYDTMNKEFVVPESVTQADAWLSSQLQQIQSGKTSYTDRFNEALNNYLNREEFEYDVDNDQLFQQALASAMRSGKSAMQDTIGQASALTGGYGSTYATSAGNQAYNAFIEDAYNNLPEYYQMALEAYQAEGQEMYNQVALLGDADANEYQRMVNAFDVTFQQRNQAYNEAYTAHRDEKTDAYNTANMQLQEYGQRVENAYNVYSAYNDQYIQKHNIDYQTWADEVTNATNLANMLNSDYWSQTNYDESVRQFNAQLAEEQRQFDKTFAANYTSDGKGGYVAKSSGSGFGSGGGTSDYSLSSTDINKCKEIYEENGGGEAGLAAVNEYLTARGKAPQNETEADIVHSAIGYKGAAGGSANSNVTTGTVSNFRTVKGDNFDVTVNGTDYRVENKGKVTDETLVAKLNNINVDNESVVLCDGAAYAKYANGWYKIGATNYFLNIGFANSSGYQDLLGAMQ